MENITPTPQTAVDRIADGGNLQMMKAAIPYLPPAIQKGMSLYAKLLELQNLMTYYNQPVRACSAETASANSEEILNDIRAYCNETQRQSLDHALNLINTLKMYQEIQNM